MTELPRYRLDADHYLYDRIVEKGTEVGEGTQYILPEDFPPSANMTPLNEAAEEAIREYAAGRSENWGRRPDENIPIRGEYIPAAVPPVKKMPAAPKKAVPPPPEDGRIVLGATLPKEDFDPEDGNKKIFGTPKVPGSGPMVTSPDIPGQGPRSK